MADFTSVWNKSGKMICPGKWVASPTTEIWFSNRESCQPKPFLLWFGLIISNTRSYPHSLDYFICTGVNRIAAPYPLFSRRRRLTGIGIAIINLRRSDDRLRFIMGIFIPIRRGLNEWRPSIRKASLKNVDEWLAQSHSEPLHNPNNYKA